jgi:hypothetical protein
VHPSEPAYPCCLPALGRFTRCTPHEGLAANSTRHGLVRMVGPAAAVAQPTAPRYVSFPAEDSPRGLGRTLGKRVGIKPSRVRISYPPPPSSSRNARPSGRGPGRALIFNWAVISFARSRLLAPPVQNEWNSSNGGSNNGSGSLRALQRGVASAAGSPWMVRNVPWVKTSGITVQPRLRS